MSNNNNSNNNNTNNDNKNSNQVGPKFNEYQAYEELRLIIARALEYGDFALLEASIAAWKSKYPLDAFVNPEIIRKIKEILNRDFLTRIFGDFWAKKLLHENETLQQQYTKLEGIINKAKKTGDYKTALKNIKTWKLELHEQGLSVASFDKSLKSKVCFFLLLPNKKIKNQEEAASELKKLFEKSSKMDKETLSSEISNWQNKFSTKIFDKKLQQEVNNTTAELLESVINKGQEEESLKRIQETLSSSNNQMPYLVVSQILSEYDLSHFSEDVKSQIYDLATQALFIQEYNKKTQESISLLPESNTVTSFELHALDMLTNIIDKDSHNLNSLISWIYETRKISFSQYSRDEIVRKFASVGYKIPNQASYSIPEISIDLSDSSKLKKLQKEIIINYLGIISIGNSISSSGKESIKKVNHPTKVNTVSSSTSPVNKSIILNAYDNFPNNKKECDIDDKSKNNIEIVIQDIIDENASYSIDLTKDVDLTTSITFYPEGNESSDEQPSTSNLHSTANEVVNKNPDFYNIDIKSDAAEEVEPQGSLPTDTIANSNEEVSTSNSYLTANEVINENPDFYNIDIKSDAVEEVEPQDSLSTDTIANSNEEVSTSNSYPTTNKVVNENPDFYNIDIKSDAVEEVEPQDSLSTDTIANSIEESSSQARLNFSSDINVVDNLNDLNNSIHTTEIKQTTNSEEDTKISPYALTPEDQANLEEITYISAAFPIMSMALNNLNRNYKTDYPLEKNNGF